MTPDASQLLPLFTIESYGMMHSQTICLDRETGRIYSLAYEPLNRAGRRRVNLSHVTPLPYDRARNLARNAGHEELLPLLCEERWRELL